MSMTVASADYFQRVAGQWDDLRSGYFGEGVRAAAISKAYLRPEMIVADIGTGTGFMAAGLAPLVSKVYALDGSAAMIEVARRNLGGFVNVELQVSEGTSLPLGDGSVDAVFANMYLHHCPDPLAAMREMVRVLKPGGRLVVTDLVAHSHEWMRAEMADEWLGFDRNHTLSWLRAAGLVNIIVDCTEQCCCAASSDTTSRASESENEAKISVFVATGTRRMAGVREAVQANYGALAQEGGCCCDEGNTSSNGCCSSDSGAPGEAITLFNTGYLPEQLAAIPAEAANLSLGCGNPTAIASLREGEVVLDIGSGGGIDALYAARKVGDAGRVIGLDMTPAMIERASRAAQRAGIGHVKFRLGQAEAMPVEDCTVDVILSNCVINLCEDKGKVFAEAHRVLREGGRLAISDMVSDKPLPMNLRHDLTTWAGCVSGALPETEYLHLVRQAGFTDVIATRSRSSGRIGDAQVYSISLTARKGNV